MRIRERKISVFRKIESTYEINDPLQKYAFQIQFLLAWLFSLFTSRKLLKNNLNYGFFCKMNHLSEYIFPSKILEFNTFHVSRDKKVKNSDLHKFTWYGIFSWSLKTYFKYFKLELTYSASDNLTPPISRVLIGRHLNFCSLTSPTCCNSARKCTPVKYKARQKPGFPIVTETPSQLQKFKSTTKLCETETKTNDSLSNYSIVKFHCIFDTVWIWL